MWISYISVDLSARILLYRNLLNVCQYTTYLLRYIYEFVNKMASCRYQILYISVEMDSTFYEVGDDPVALLSFIIDQLRSYKFEYYYEKPAHTSFKYIFDVELSISRSDNELEACKNQAIEKINGKLAHQQHVQEKKTRAQGEAGGEDRAFDL